MKTRINIGTFDKETAKNIRNEIKRVKSFREQKVEVEFKSRTYGNKFNSHDGSKRISEADKVAIYLDVEGQNKNSLQIDYETRKRIIEKAISNLKYQESKLESILLYGIKGFENMSVEELIEFLL